MGAGYVFGRHDPNKAPLLTVEWSWRYFYFAKFRCANFRRFQIGWLTIMTRAKRLSERR